MEEEEQQQQQPEPPKPVNPVLVPVPAKAPRVAFLPLTRAQEQQRANRKR